MNMKDSSYKIESSFRSKCFFIYYYKIIYKHSNRVNELLDMVIKVSTLIPISEHECATGHLVKWHL